MSKIISLSTPRRWIALCNSFTDIGITQLRVDSKKKLKKFCSNSRAKPKTIEWHPREKFFLIFNSYSKFINDIFVVSDTVEWCNETSWQKAIMLNPNEGM